MSCDMQSSSELAARPGLRSATRIATHEPTQVAAAPGRSSHVLMRQTGSRPRAGICAVYCIDGEGAYTVDYTAKVGETTLEPSIHLTFIVPLLCSVYSLYSARYTARAIHYTAYTLYSTIHRPSAARNKCKTGKPKARPVGTVNGLLSCCKL